MNRRVHTNMLGYINTPIMHVMPVMPRPCSYIHATLWRARRSSVTCAAASRLHLQPSALCTMWLQQVEATFAGVTASLRCDRLVVQDIDQLVYELEDRISLRFSMCGSAGRIALKSHLASNGLPRCIATSGRKQIINLPKARQ